MSASNVQPASTPDTQEIEAPRPLPGLHSIRQEYNNWCWAACALMVWRSKNNGNLDIYDIVNTLRPGNDCRHQPASIPCSAGCRPEEIKILYQRLGFHCSDAITPTANQEMTAIIRTELTRHARPVQIAYNIDRPARNGHLVLVAGITAGTQTTERFLVFDPLFGDGDMTIKQLATLNGRGHWIQYWTNIDPL